MRTENEQERSIRETNVSQEEEEIETRTQRNARRRVSDESQQFKR
jgi:hypothetical protein